MKVCVVGLGYVGLTLALVLADCGIKVIGIDSNKEIVTKLRSGKPTISEKDVGSLLSKHKEENFIVSSEIDETDFEVFVISVGTPLNEQNSPILDYLINSCDEIGKRLKTNQLVIVRSTVPVGATRNVIIPILEEKSGLKAGSDFEVVFAPERTAEGVAISELRSNPQIIGGLSEKSIKQAEKLFEKMTKTIIPLSSLEAAEMIKLIDNSYRDVRFAYANEIALICETLKLDARECIRKANFGYSRNSIPEPSPGVGGPCLSKDPHILVHVSKQFGFEPNLIMHSRWLNEFVPSHLASKIDKKITAAGKNKKNLKILIIGFAFKGEPETDDTRNSSTIILLKELKKQYSMIYGYDPVVKMEEIERLGAIPTTIKEGFHNADCVIIMNNHKSYTKLDMKNLIKSTSKPLIFVDCWSMFKEIQKEGGIVYTGIGVE